EGPAGGTAANREDANQANGEPLPLGGNPASGEQATAERATVDAAAIAAIEATRARVARSMIGTLFIALGTPMLLAGDEACRTQHGNNNAYCQDNEISWFDWELAASPQGRQMTRFVARMIALRKSHPLLRETR